MIRIRTVGRAQFRNDCGRLWDSVERECSPTVVVGIRSGGWWVAKEMNLARSDSGAVFLPLTCRRPGTAAKERSQLFRFLVRVLPYFVLNELRRLEYYFVTLPRCRSARGGMHNTPLIESAELSAIRQATALLPAGACVLVVDDSLDSGATLWNVMTALRDVVPADVRILTAAFTVLGPSPIVPADFSLYQRINCRFPWSFDFHG